MRHLVRLDAEDRLALALGGHRRIVEKHALEGEDRAPILHRAEELRLSRAGDIIELGERVGRPEIFVVIRKDLRLGVERGLRLGPVAAAHHDPDLGLAGHLGDPAEVAAAEEQQVGGHDRGRLEPDFLEAAAERLRLAPAGMLLTAISLGRNPGGEVEGRLVIGLVPAREEAPRVGRLELREDRARSAPAGFL